MEESKGIGRREFLKSAVAGGALAFVGPIPRISRYGCGSAVASVPTGKRLSTSSPGSHCRAGYSSSVPLPHSVPSPEAGSSSCSETCCGSG